MGPEEALLRGQLRPGEEASVWRNYPHYNLEHDWHTDAELYRMGQTGLERITREHVPYFGQVPLIPGLPGE
ncbi:MAG: hypothetical protein CVU38_20945 [Chloroflexi bacterium HGW-Chloroflexi-1]|nr:MAG: hypothetical protein CVU38_20945 [Chloroflexi bacterium HGW-Chloroflexi-1]